MNQRHQRGCRVDTNLYSYRRFVNSTRAPSLALAAPESIDSTARGIASFKESALPAATRAAAAFIRTISRRGDFSPSRIFQIISALAFVSPPVMALSGAVL